MRSQGRILRSVAPAAAGRLQDFLLSPLGAELTREGRLIETWLLPAGEQAAQGRDAGVWFEHRRVPFPSYPYEWSPAMLHAAADLTLTLARRLHEHGLGLKDATPYNILFDGARPVFVDLLSIEDRTPGDPVWRACAQFASTFLLPLALNRRNGLPIAAMLLGSREGVDPEAAWRQLSWAARLRSPFRSLVTMPELLRRLGLVKQDHYAARALDNPEKASFILDFLYARLERQLARFRPARLQHSHWTSYMCQLSYGGPEFAAKQRFVETALAAAAPARVLDIGCNTGAFSVLAARAGASVVAIDYDEAVIDHLWRAASHDQLDILPLVVNLARPTPAMGWLYSECDSFLDRARGSFDMILMLALIHHLMVSERIPLDQVMEMAASLTTGHAIIEYVDPADPMFRTIARGREHLHADLNLDAFTRSAARLFHIERSEQVMPTRTLFHLRKR